MNKIITLILLNTIIFTLNAQTKIPFDSVKHNGFRGMAEFTAAVGARQGITEADFSVLTILGYQVNSTIFLGIGTGFDIEKSKLKYGEKNIKYFRVPLYAEVRITPLRKTVGLAIDTKLGFQNSVLFPQAYENIILHYYGAFARIQIGPEIILSKRNRLFAGLGYEFIQQHKKGYILGYTIRELSLHRVCASVSISF